MSEAIHVGLLPLLLHASLWLTIGVLLLAMLRPLLLRLGGAPLAYRSWWLLPLVLIALCLPLPPLPMGNMLPAIGLVALPDTSVPRIPDMLSWPALLSMAWWVGIGVSMLRNWRAQRRFESGMGTLRPRADGSWQASADPGLPALVGLWQPRIVVGPRFDAQFDAVERELVLQHERHHLRHGDHWANGLLLLARCVFWFHPLLPWAARRFLRDQELACDARILEAHPTLRRPYAMALLKVQGAPAAAPMACHWRRPSLLKERITMLARPKRKAWGWVAGQLLVAGMCVTVGAAAWASQATSTPAVAGPSAAVGDRDAKVLKMPPPRYPKHAADNSLTGEVVLRVDIGADGQAGDVRVLKATTPGVFEAVSIAAAKQWTYQAAVRRGRPVASALRIPITFAMDETEPVP